MTIATLIVAAGRGTRAGGPHPKQWQTVNGRLVAEWTIDLFLSLGPVVLIVNPDDRPFIQDVADHTGVQLVDGGAERADSVRAGLDALAEMAPDKVLIHDVARPCTPPDVITGVVQALNTHQGAAPGLPVTDALWTGADGKVTGTQDRGGLFRAQTPQGFDYAAIRAAHRTNATNAADDVEVARAAGIAVAITQGSELNLKITAPEDFERAARILEDLHGSATG